MALSLQHGKSFLAGKEEGALIREIVPKRIGSPPFGVREVIFTSPLRVCVPK